MKIIYNDIFDKLFPICRSITGDGYRNSISILKKYIKLKTYKVPSGTKVFDWEVPKEWIINDAYIKFKGKKICDFKKNNLSVMNYSISMNKVVNLNNLKQNIYSIPKYPNYVPYVTSYYNKNWGFSMSHNQKKKLKKGSYEIFIDSKHKNGSVEYSLSKLKGQSKKDFLISSYLCHPSMANNELSGPLVLIGLYNKLKQHKYRHFNYIFLINPETIGSICFLNRFGKKLIKSLQAGIVLTCLGGPKKLLSYKKSRKGNSSFDKLIEHLNKKKHILLRNFDPSEGSDERQFCSSEFNLPVGQVARTVYGQYKEYHTDADNKKFMQITKIEKSVNELYKIILLHEKCLPLKRKEPFCEYQLGKRNMYPNTNTPKDNDERKLISNKQLNQKIKLYILSYADGKHDIIDIAEILNVDIYRIERVYDMLKENNLLL